MNAIPDGLELKESPIHGQGIFATRAILSGECLGNFTGVEMSWKDFKDKYGSDYRYCYRKLRTQKIIDGKEARCFITWINSPASKEEATVYLKGGRLYALSDIQKGDELLLWYGRMYPALDDSKK